MSCWRAIALVMAISVSGFATLAHAAEATSGKTVPPAPVKSAPPPYPEALKRSGVTGVVVVEFIVTTAGNVEQATVVASPHPGLAEVSLDTIGKWKYNPALKDGQPVAVRLRQSFTFGRGAASSPDAPKP